MPPGKYSRKTRASSNVDVATDDPPKRSILRRVAALLENLLALEIGAGAVRHRIRRDPYARAAHPREHSGAEVRGEQHDDDGDRDRRYQCDPAGELGSDLRNHAPVVSPSPSLPGK